VATVPRPGSTPSVVADAHYHAIGVSKKYAAYLAGIANVETNSAAKRAREDRNRRRATTYASGETGRT
jgi:hypothetical protein